MGRSFESVRMGVKDVSARWQKASRALKKEYQVYGQKQAEMARKHSSEAFYALDDPSSTLYDKGSVKLWSRERGLRKVCAAYPPSFYMHLKDPPAYQEMIEALESRFKAEECSFRTIFGTFQGHRIYASRKVAEKIEIQTRHQAELYNVDIRQDLRYMAEKDLSPCGDREGSRFLPNFEIPLTSIKLQVAGDPTMPEEICGIEIHNGRKQRLEGPERQVISDLLDLIKTHDPDLILCPHADTWIPTIISKAGRYGLDQTISRTGFFKPMASKSY